MTCLVVIQIKLQKAFASAIHRWLILISQCHQWKVFLILYCLPLGNKYKAKKDKKQYEYENTPWIENQKSSSKRYHLRSPSEIKSTI